MSVTKTLLRGLLCLCLAPFLTACKPDIVVRPEIVEVPVVRYRPLPATLTEPLLPPPMPARWTNGELVERIIALEGVIQRANADRAQAKALTDEP